LIAWRKPHSEGIRVEVVFKFGIEGCFWARASKTLQLCQGNSESVAMGKMRVA